MIVRSPRVRPGKFVLVGVKRLLQQYPLRTAIHRSPPYSDRFQIEAVRFHSLRAIVLLSPRSLCEPFGAGPRLVYPILGSEVDAILGNLPILYDDLLFLNPRGLNILE